MKIKYILILLVLSFVLPFRLSSQDKTIQPFFEYPVVPDKLTNTNLRANYMVEHFWEKCKLEKETITNINAFHESFTDYLSFFILAEKPAVEKSIKKFVERVAKNADNLNLKIGRNRILEILSTKGFNYSAEQIRAKLKELEMLGLVNIGTTRQGSSISQAGKLFLQEQ